MTDSLVEQWKKAAQGHSLYGEFLYELSSILKYGDNEIVDKIASMVKQAKKTRSLE